MDHKIRYFFDNPKCKLTQAQVINRLLVDHLNHEIPYNSAVAYKGISFKQTSICEMFLALEGKAKEKHIIVFALSPNDSKSVKGRFQLTFKENGKVVGEDNFYMGMATKKVCDFLGISCPIQDFMIPLDTDPERVEYVMGWRDTWGKYKNTWDGRSYKPVFQTV